MQAGRARQSAVPEIDDPLPARSSATLKRRVAEAQPAASSRGKRIEVDFDRSQRQSPAFAERSFERSPAAEASSYREPESKSHWLLLIGGAFYGGLRASDWVKGRTSGPPTPTTDPMKQGRALFDAGNYGAALSQFNAAAAQDTQNAEAHYWLGRAQLETGDYAKAAASFETAITRRPTFFDAYAQAAQAYELAGDKAKAAQMLTRGAEERRKPPAPVRADNANASR